MENETVTIDVPWGIVEYTKEELLHTVMSNHKSVKKDVDNCKFIHFTWHTKMVELIEPDLNNLGLHYEITNKPESETEVYLKVFI